MKLKVVLPDMLVTDINNCEVEVDSSNLQELCDELNKKCSNCVDKIFDENKNVRKNIILVLNKKIIRKSQYKDLKFNEYGVLEILLQLAGG